MSPASNHPNETHFPNMAELQRFLWRGIDRHGDKVRGELPAVSAAVAKAEIQGQGIRISKISKKHVSYLGKRQKISATDIVMFTRHLATMINAGLPLVDSLDGIARSHERPAFQSLVMSLRMDVAEGMTLTDALRKHPRHFDNLYCNLVSAGEQSGTLDVTLNRLASNMEKTQSLKKKVKKALYYPAAVLVVAVGVTAILLLFVIPEFETLYHSLGAKLPIFTRMVLRASEIMQAYWWLIFGGGALALILAARAKRRSRAFCRLVDRLVFRIKVIGPILKKAMIARTVRTLSTVIAAGIPLTDALQIATTITNNAIFTDALKQVREDVVNGQELNLALRASHLFPNMVLQMVEVGEHTGAMEQMLDKLASYYEEDVDMAVSGLSSLLEPMIIVILGALVGSIVVAMYLPIFKLGMAL